MTGQLLERGFWVFTRNCSPDARTRMSSELNVRVVRVDQQVGSLPRSRLSLARKLGNLPLTDELNGSGFIHDR